MLPSDVSIGFFFVIFFISNDSILCKIQSVAFQEGLLFQPKSSEQNDLCHKLPAVFQTNRKAKRNNNIHIFPKIKLFSLNHVLKTKPNKQNKIISLNKEIISRGNQKDLHGVMQILNDIEKLYQPNVFTMNAVLNAMVVSNAFELGGMWKRFIDNGVSPNTISYNTALKACARSLQKEETKFARSLSSVHRSNDMSHSIQEAVRLFKEMEDTGINPDIITFNTIINICGTAGEVDRAWQYVQRMSNLGISCNEFTLSTMLKCLSKSPHSTLEDLFSLFDEMTSKYCIKPNIAAYNILADRCQKEKQYELANSILTTKIAEAGIRPDVHSYNIILKGQCSSKSVSSALTCYENLLKAGLQPDQVTFNTLIDALARAEELEKALDYIEQMKQRGLKIDGSTLNPVARLLGAQSGQGKIQQDFKNTGKGSIERALLLFEEHNVKPDSITATVMMHSLIQTNQPFRALKVFSRMTATAKVMPNRIVYNALINALAACIPPIFKRPLSEFEFSAVKALYERDLCTVNNVSSTEQVEILLDIVDTTLCRMHQGGMKPDIITFNSVLNVGAEAAAVARSMKWYNSMSDYQIKPDITTINTLLRCCAKGKDMPIALQVFGDIEFLNLTADSHTYAALTNVFINCNQMKKALELMRSMALKRNMQPHSTSYQNFVRKCAATNNMILAEEAFSLYINHTMNNNTSPDQEGNHVWVTWFDAYSLSKNISQAELPLTNC